MDLHMMLDLAPALTAIVLLAQLAYKQGKQDQRILQLEQFRDADDRTFKEYRREEDKRFEALTKTLGEVRDSIIRLEARQEAYYHMQEAGD
jgi:uncharacterized protein YydD (DUF2326 family)